MRQVIEDFGIMAGTVLALEGARQIVGHGAAYNMIYLPTALVLPPVGLALIALHILTKRRFVLGAGEIILSFGLWQTWWLANREVGGDAWFGQWQMIGLFAAAGIGASGVRRLAIDSGWALRNPNLSRWTVGAMLVAALMGLWL